MKTSLRNRTTVSQKTKVVSNKKNLKEQYEMVQGHPTVETLEKVYDDADLNRAVQTYKFFYPTVSGATIFKGNEDVGIIVNKTFGLLDTKPKHIGFTLNSDTPYAPILLDLKDGPMVVELPAAPLIVVAMDINQRWVADMGIPGPDEGKGGKHLILPLDYSGDLPQGYHIWKSTSNRLLVGVRSLPVNGDVKEAIEKMKEVLVRPLYPTGDWTDPVWVDITAQPQDTTPLKWESNIQFWEILHEVINAEPVYEPYRTFYGELAILGIAKGNPFDPDERLQNILERAALIGNAQMRVQAFANRRPDRVVWQDRQWEWIALRPENGDFDASTYVDLDARETWFYQAIGASPAMSRRKAGQGSLYWLGLKDTNGNYVDGGKTYKLHVPFPVPEKLFWSVTIYDIDTRSQIQTDQGRAALRSMFELKDKLEGSGIDLYFGPQSIEGQEQQWIQTIPGKGWFAYFRIYAPQEAAFNGSWKPGDFELL